MIVLNDTYAFTRDAHGWELHTYRMGKDKQGEPKRFATTTYYANLAQVCDAIIDRCAGEAETLEELKALLQGSSAQLLQLAEKRYVTD